MSKIIGTLLIDGTIHANVYEGVEIVPAIALPDEISIGIEKQIRAGAANGIYQSSVMIDGKPRQYQWEYFHNVKDIKKLAQEAIDVQDACNPLGVSKGFARSLQELVEYLRANNLPNDTDAIIRHPIHRLWASKIHDLARMGMSDDNAYSDAYEECRRLADAETENKKLAKLVDNLIKGDNNNAKS